MAYVPFSYSYSVGAEILVPAVSASHASLNLSTESGRVFTRRGKSAGSGSIVVSHYNSYRPASLSPSAAGAFPHMSFYTGYVKAPEEDDTGHGLYIWYGSSAIIVWGKTMYGPHMPSLRIYSAVPWTDASGDEHRPRCVIKPVDRIGRYDVHTVQGQGYLDIFFRFVDYRDAHLAQVPLPEEILACLHDVRLLTALFRQKPGGQWVTIGSDSPTGSYSTYAGSGSLVKPDYPMGSQLCALSFTPGYVREEQPPNSHAFSPLAEQNWFDGGTLGGSSPYLYDSLSRALTSLYDGLPVSSVNQIENVLDLFGLVKAGLSLPKGIQDLYLAYRYGYRTTKSDLMEMISLFRRLRSLPSVIKAYGSDRTTVTVGDGTPIQLYSRVTADFNSENFTVLMDKLELLGFKLNAYNAWDLIPFSFMVDWFVPVQDTLHVIDQISQEQSVDYHATNWCTSVQVRFISANKERVQNYLRRWGSKPSLRPTAAFSGPSASGKSWIMRVGDIISITTRL